MKNSARIKAVSAVLLSAASLGACQSISEIGRGPQLSAIQDPRETMPEAKVISMPMPERPVVERGKNSLWQQGSTTFFADQRAAKRGDILTVTIDIKDEARLKNETERERTTSETAGIPRLFGLETKAADLIPGMDASRMVEMQSGTSTQGAGSINRNETIRLKVAAFITDVLPNGNFAIAGKQEIRVNHELRELRISGVIRPQDISSGNTVTYDQIAEARIAYGGRGTVSDVQQPSYGQQLYNVVMPF